MKKILLSIPIILISTRAFSVPEAVRYGKFSCSSCHVSPAGGGMLTNYGRMFAAEKLSTWQYEGEENLLHGLLRPNETILAGGDARWVDYRTESGGTSFRKFWRMQTDLELAIHFGPLWFQGMMGTKPAGPMDDQKERDHLIHREYSIRADLFDDHVIMRAGLFLPKFGLMQSDHTAFNRMAVGFAPDAEQTQVEATIQNDEWEATVAALIQNELYDRKDKSKAGFNVGFSRFIAGNHRVNLSTIHTIKSSDSEDSTMTAYSVSGVVSLTKRIFSLLEIDRISSLLQRSHSTAVTQSSAGYLTLNAEILKGVIPFFRYEYWNRNLNIAKMNTARWGAGLTWYPRPHFQAELRGLRTAVEATPNMRDETDLILHYYF